MKYILRNQTRRPRDTSPHVSLFPFLAVLICTMGALVPLLFTISRQARLQAEQAAVSKDAEIKADVKSEREMVQWRIEQLQTSRKKTETDIETARLELGHLEDHSRRLRVKISELEKTIGEIDRSGSGDGHEHTATAAELEDLRKQVADAERQLAEAKIRAAGKKRSFAIVPYEGPNSTHRRPIYLECREDAVVLQPEGIVLSVQDFEGPMGPSNPLAMALRAEREYLLSQHGFDPQRDGEPYPLLLVRPNGIIAYYAARAAMKSWGPEFGYEFVEADWKLAYQPPDPQMAQVVNNAVESARVVQQRLIAAAPRQYSQKAMSSVSRGSSSRGGEGNGSGSGGDGTPGGSSRGSGISHGGGSGGSRGSGGAHGGYGGSFGGAGGGEGDDSDSWDNKRPLPGAPDPFLAGVNNPYASLAVGGSGTGGTGTGGTGTGGSGIQGSEPAYGGGGNGSGAAGSGPALGPANGSGIAGFGGVGGSPGNSNGIAGGGYPQDGAQGTPVGNGNGTTGQGNSASRAVLGPAMSEGHENQSTGQGTLFPVGQGLTTGGTSAAGQPAAAGQAATQGQGGATGPLMRSADPPDIFASRVAASNAAKNPADNRTAADSSASTRGQVTPPLHPGEWHEKPEPPPEPVVQVKAGKKGDSAKYRAQDWGLKDTAHGSVPITRPVVIECQSDRLLLLPERGKGGNPVAVMASGTQSSIDDLVSAIWDRMGQWGMAGRGMYWRPVLHVRVAPGGEQRFSDLQVLLEGSGLDVVRQ
jgi:hypothetical protein